LNADILDGLGKSQEAMNAAKNSLDLWKSLEGQDGANAQRVAQWLTRYRKKHPQS
jgi:hypothetical protein